MACREGRIRRPRVHFSARKVTTGGSMKPFAYLIAALMIVAGPATPSVAADDSKLCRESTDAGIAACNRAIASRRYKGRDLGFIYLNRGQTYYERKDFDRAIADFTRA